MKLFDNHNIAISPLSPVHMGWGQDYEPTNYVIDGGVLWAFDSMEGLRALPPKERERLERLVGAHNPVPDLHFQVNKLFWENRCHMKAVAGRCVRVASGVDSFYQSRIEYKNELTIARTAYNPASDQPILPGSGIKGAIRTALLDHLNGGYGLQHGERDSAFQIRLLNGSFETDPLRLLQLSDASVAHLEQDGYGVADGNLATEIQFTLNRKKFKTTAIKNRSINQLIECIPPLLPRVFRGALAIQNKPGGVGRSGKWPSLSFTFEEIASACNQFYYEQRYLDDLKHLSNRGYLDQQWLDGVAAILQKAKPAMADGRAFLLRIGRHSGAEAVTVKGVRQIKIIGARGEPPTYKHQATTFWLAADKGIRQITGMIPFGWVLVELLPDSKSENLFSWPDLGFAANQDVAGWLKGVENEKVRAQEERELLVVQWAEEEKLAEEAAKAAAKRRELRESLSPIDQILFDLEEALVEDQSRDQPQRPGGTLSNALSKALRTARLPHNEWPSEACHRLADLATNIYDHIGWGAGRKRRARREEIAELESR